MDLNLLNCLCNLHIQKSTYQLLFLNYYFNTQQDIMEKNITFTPLYTAKVMGTSGRDGHVKSSDGVIDLDVRLPKGMGGDETGKHTNPEQLFAAGYAACFGGALSAIAKNKKIKLTSPPEVTVHATFGKEGDGFGLAVDIFVHISDMEISEVQSLTEAAHQICPYSKATRGNIPVNIHVN